MADESIVFAVGDDGGTAALAQQLKQLGVTGAQALDAVAKSNAGVSQTASEAATAMQAVGAGSRAGINDVNSLTEALYKLALAESAASGQQAAAGFDAFQKAVQGAAGATQQAANAVAPLTTNLQSLGAGYITGTQAAMAHRAQTAQTSTAWQVAYGAATSLKSGIAGFAQASASSMGAVAQLTQAVIGFTSAAKLINSVDITETVTRQIAALVPNVQEADKVFHELAQTAITTQQPLETVSQAFSQIYAAIKGNGGTTEQAALAIDNLSRVFKATGVNASAIPRILHDISEGLAAGTLGGQQLRSLLIQAGASLPLLDQALGGNIRALSSHAQAVDKARDRVDALKRSIDDSNPSVGTSREEVDKWKNKITESQSAIDKLRGKLNDTTYTAKQHAEQQKELTRVTDEYNKELPTLTSNLDKAKGKFGEATNAVDAKKRADLAGAEAALKHSTALDSESILAGLTGQKFTEAARALNLGVGTIGGAFQALQAQFDVYLHDSGDADELTKAFSVTLGVIGQNLNTIVPLIGGVAAAFVIYRTAATAAALATAILEAEYAPFIIGAIALAAAVLALSGHYGVFNGIIDKLYASMRGGTQATNDNKVANDSNTKSVIGVTDAAGKLKTQVDTTTKATTDGTKEQASAWTNLGTTIEDTFNSVVSSVSAKLTDFFAWIAGKVQAIIDAIKSIASFGGGSATDPGPAGSNPGSRDGSSFTVGGASGVDSKLIAVSPGERVTIQTPSQAKSGEIPQGVPKFRDGGSMDLTGVSAQFNAANDNAGITGYKTPGNYYTDSEGTEYSAASIRAATAAEAAAAAAQSAAAAATQVAASTADLASGYSGTSSDTDFTTSASTSSTPHFDAAGYSAAVAAWNKKVGDATKNYTSVGGVQKPTNVSGQGWSIEQTKVYATDGQRITLSADSLFHTAAGGSVSGPTELAIEARKSAGQFPVYNDYIKARDGLDYTMPGGSGVDSKVIQLAVSPGENVQVKTPAQQRTDIEAQSRVGGGSKVINFTVNTPDSNSFRKSDRQVQSDLKRALARVR